MSAVVEPGEHYRVDFERLRGELPGARVPWVRHRREAALARFAEHGFPTTRDEAWKYTDAGAITRRAFAPALVAALVPVPGALEPFRIEGLDCHRLVFLDGHLAPELSDVGTLPPGVVVGSLARTLEETPDSVEDRLGCYAGDEDNGFAALNTAFMSDGIYLHLPPGATLDRPVHVLHLSTGAGDGAVVHPRNLVVAEAGARAVLIETYAGLHEAACLTNVQTEVLLGEDARVEHYKLQQEGGKTFHIANTGVYLPARARYRSHVIDAGGRLVRNEIRVRLDGAGSECVLNGLYLLGARQHVDNHTVIDHLAPEGTSREYYKGVLEGHARSVFSGKVIVHPGAQRTDALQTNHNLLLSENAEADIRPQLEIYADDVKCAHGATVGRLDPDALYYLKSRAIDEDAARSLLIYAFANDVLARLPLEPVRAYLERTLTARLLHGRKAGELL